MCELSEIENEVLFLFCCPVYEDLRDIFFAKMSSIYADFFWLEEYEKLELCFFVADFICQAWERRQSILLKSEL